MLLTDSGPATIRAASASHSTSWMLIACCCAVHGIRFAASRQTEIAKCFCWLMLGMMLFAEVVICAGACESCTDCTAATTHSCYRPGTGTGGFATCPGLPRGDTRGCQQIRSIPNSACDGNGKCVYPASCLDAASSDCGSTSSSSTSSVHSTRFACVSL